MTAPIQIEVALEEHSRCIRDDQSGARRIDTYIREGLGWTWTKRYRPQRFEWCGAAVAFWWLWAGLSHKVRRKHLASCYRLWRWSGKGKPNERRIAPEDLQPGDIAVVGPEPAPRDAPRSERKARPKWGRHIVLVHRVHEDHIDTVEGNAHGRLGDGTRGEGVVRCERPLSASRTRTYRVLYGIRPVEGDIDGG
jgi:hypothetical protein